MTAAAEVQALLRFLSQDAKVPLSVCLSKVGDLRKAQLSSAENISKSDLNIISTIFADEKVAKQVLNAAKRVANPKKRPASQSANPTAIKLVRGADGSAQPSETALELPRSDLEEDTLNVISIQTNRAPLVLAFAVTLLKYTMPEQPVSSRLSLAQAVVSANSQSKAKSIGITTENTAEEEGWGKGQPKVKIMGREIAVMRRVLTQQEDVTEDSTQTTVKADRGPESQETYWGMDLDALRKSTGPLIAGKNAGSATGLPIYTPESARNYLLRSMAIIEDAIKPKEGIKPITRADEDANPESSSNSSKPKQSSSPRTSPPSKKPTAKELTAKKEQAAATLLQTLDLLFSSWAHLSRDELDRRAWSWYLHVRPDIAQGQAGWGQKGRVELADILKLRKQSGS
jgi:hypothetical protein